MTGTDLTPMDQRTTAKIYSFPAGGRAGLSRQKETADGTMTGCGPSVPVVDGSSWYHDEAIHEAVARESQRR